MELDWGDVFKGGLSLAGQGFQWMTQREQLATQERIAELNQQASIAAQQARAAVGIAQAQVQPATATIYTANTRMVIIMGMIVFFGSLMLRQVGDRGS